MGRTPAHRAPRPRRLTPKGAGAAAAGAVAAVVLAQTLLIPAGESGLATASTGVATSSGSVTDAQQAGTSTGGGGGETTAKTENVEVIDVATNSSTTLAIIGDSYLNGKGAPDGQGMGVRLAKRLDLDLLNAAEGGTGWADDGPEPSQTSSYDEHAEKVLRGDPAIVVIGGGFNDHAAIAKDLLSYDEVATNARRLLTQLAGADGVRTVVFGPFWVSGNPPDSMLRLRDVLEAEAQRADVAFVDPLDEQWIKGGTSTTTGNAERFIRRDRIHPTPQGHRYFARRMASSIENLR